MVTVLGTHTQLNRLFRRFYVLVLAYIYLTRILVYLVSNTVPFHYLWTAPFLDEMITFAFYLVTGCVGSRVHCAL